jgi:hypothetical protein
MSILFYVAPSWTVDLLSYSLGSEIVVGGDFTGSNGDPINAWFDDNGGNTGNNQEIQNNKAEISNPNLDGTSYIGRASLGKNYLGKDGAQVPLIAQVDFTLDNNPTNVNDDWYYSLQLWETSDNHFQAMLGYLTSIAPPGDWDTYGYGTHSQISGIWQDPNNPNIIVNSSDTSGKLRVELVPYQNRAGGVWRVEARAYYWNGSSWIILNKNRDYVNWPDSIGNTGLYTTIRNSGGVVDPSPVTSDNLSAKEVTDHSWGKEADRIGNGFHFDYANSRIVAEDQGGGGSLHFYYDNIYEDGVSYTTNITIEDYVDGQCKVWHGNTLLATLTANGSYELVGVCDYDGANNYDELWLTSDLANNDYSITALTTRST